MDRTKSYAVAAVWVSALALLATLVLWYIEGSFSTNVQIAGAVTVVAFALFVYFDPDRARGLFSGRQARYGSNALVMFAAFLGILVVANYLVYMNATDWGLRWDLTEDQERTLAPETIATLESLEAPVIVYAFYTATNPGVTRATELLEDFTFYAGGNLVYEFIDPNENPIRAQEAGIPQDGTVQFTFEGESILVTTVTEPEFTNAILSVLNPGARGIYFITGHGEFSVDATGEESLSQLRQALEGKNYVVAALSLLTDPEIPEDAVALVIAGSLQPLTEPEMALIAEFVDAGGALVVASEPPFLTDFGATPDPVAAYLAETWGIGLGTDLVVDLQAVEIFNSAFIAISGAYGEQPITSDLLQRQLATVFPLARSVVISNAELENVIQTELISTSTDSWAETDFQSINDGTAALDEDDLAGPVGLAVAAENSLTGGRVVVFGDVDFMANTAYAQFGNGALILNTIDWLTDRESLITLTPRDVTQRFVIPPQGNTIRLIQFGTVILIPGLVLLSGIVVWVLRRRRA
ncbi:MAG TPA: GldG family protein [Anaerolineales bacterium]|nr:GldG family protein [Anaerolineales bacterium]